MAEKGLCEYLFPSTWSVELKKSAGNDLAFSLFKFTIRHFEPAFDFIGAHKFYKLKDHYKIVIIVVPKN